MEIDFSFFSPVRFRLSPYQQERRTKGKMMLIYDTLYPRKHTESSADEDSNQVAGDDNLGTVIKAETATLISAPEKSIMHQQPELEQFYCDFCMFEANEEKSLTSHLALEHYDEIFGK